VILRRSRWSFRVSAQIVNCISIRRSGTQFIIGWQNNANASGFVLRDGITAVGNVPEPMRDHKLTL
jgi:hypothetical protein